MGLVMDIAAGQKNAAPVISTGEQQNLYRELWTAAAEKVSQEDLVKLNDLAFELGKTKKVRNFGIHSAKELLVVLGIIFSGMSDREFEAMLEARKSGRRNEELRGKNEDAG